MSSAATAGPPPTYPHHNLNGGRPVDFTNGFKENGEPGKKTPQVFRHITDIQATEPDINIHAPIRTILDQAEKLAKQADSHFDFRRPDFAFEEYLMATEITVKLIPQHKDYSELQSDRGELHRRYAALKKRINLQHDRMDEAKKLIKENNAQNGTQSAISIGYTNPDNAARVRVHFFDTADKGRASSAIPLPKQNGFIKPVPLNGTSSSIEQPVSKVAPVPGKRPAIHPKPEALQGRSIKPKATSSHSSRQSGEDLMTRYARLRGTENKSYVDNSPPKPAPVQDPRIKTRPIVVPTNPVPTSCPSSNSSPSHSRGGSLSSRPARPLGPRDLPSAPTRPLKIALGVEIPVMPRPPEAVYSPARNLEDESHSEILHQNSQIFNHYITRTSSMDSTKEPGRGFMNVDGSNPYFNSSSIANQASLRKPPLPDLASLASITAQQLQQFMQFGSRGFSILLVDIRNREDFNSGHVLWHSIICIEPITLRKGIAAEEIEQSLVISPDSEQQLYLQRHTFSLVVYYDQSTSSIRSPAYGKETALQDFHKAVYDFAYEKLQNRPLLLEGGLDAWIDLVGEGALATSKSLSTARVNSQDAMISRRPENRGPRSGVVMIAEAQQRKTEDNGYFSSGSGIGGDDFADDFYFKTAEDFMRRFPAVSEIKESMMSPSNRMILASQVPAMPQKAVTPGASQNHMFSRLNSTQTATEFPELWENGHKGLYNRGNLCYMNAAIQALSCIHEIRDYLFRGDWVRTKPRQNSTAEVPSLVEQQTTTRTFSNLLMHLWAKRPPNSEDYINPRTFVQSINRAHMAHLDGIVTDNLFGGQQQQDSAEFIEFLIDQLCKETSTSKIEGVPTRSDDFRKQLDEATLPAASRMVYQSLNPQSRPPIAQLMNHMTIEYLTCSDCGHRRHIPEDDFKPMTQVYFPDGQVDNSTIKLHDLLQNQRTQDVVSGFACTKCKKSDKMSKINTYFVNFPQILELQVARSKIIKGTSSKVKAGVDFPESDLDLTKFKVPGPDNSVIKYDCFAVVCHQGDSLKSGHYFAYRRDMAKVKNNWVYEDWWHYNDRFTCKSSFKEIDLKEAFILFYRRQGTH